MLGGSGEGEERLVYSTFKCAYFGKSGVGCYCLFRRLDHFRRRVNAVDFPSPLRHNLSDLDIENAIYFNVNPGISFDILGEN
jgi:hypothetical protein